MKDKIVIKEIKLLRKSGVSFRDVYRFATDRKTAIEKRKALDEGSVV